jgi:hypothetical protein
MHSYEKQLQPLIRRLNPQARSFFREILLLHDATLARMEVGDLIEKVELPRARLGLNRRQASIRLFVLSEYGDVLYKLRYTDVARVELNFPGKTVLFPWGKYPNFGDWGYDELTSGRNGLFRHEVLFASGASITIEFKKFAFQKTPISIPRH